MLNIQGLAISSNLLGECKKARRSGLQLCCGRRGWVQSREMLERLSPGVLDVSGGLEGKVGGDGKDL